MSISYKETGVDVEKGYQAVERMKKHIAKTTRQEVLGDIGAFAGLFDLSGFSYQQPVLVSGTDGVGTKLKLAHQFGIHHTVGQDLVAMCVNDIVAQGAAPLFFLDYIACGKNDPKMIEQVVSGVAQGCVQAGAALIGGETAEMPGMYEETEYDLAGFTVGIVEKSKLITGQAIQADDCVIGIASSGIHSNGFSLVRKLVDGLDVSKTYSAMTKPLQDVLLEPTKIYAKQTDALMKKIEIKGSAHITGGGFYENIPRMLPAGLGVSIDLTSWEKPPIFSFLQELGQLDEQEMYGVFNMGIGMAIVVNKDEVSTAIKILTERGESAVLIGKVTDQEGVRFES
ncbi:phosphoribosylformylglycinamidine cyclo-ligase [Lentibacillus sp. N15]|uniref:phosphoribosylformylglycinamidine cyclo-ligase n=1 Tax=Lentibacillus songyuanensis TaxID=3136161 RepID=UPI0031BB157A